MLIRLRPFAAPASLCTATSPSFLPTVPFLGLAAYNQRLQPSPAALVTPSTVSDISSAIKCASAAGVPVSAKSGGHSYASYGLGGIEEEALIIELSNFKKITVEEDGIAKIGAGNRLGDVALALNEKGRGLPHGTCPYVGIGGHASYGGYGYASRMWGLTVDTITGFDAVLANGTVVENITKGSEPDLYWVCPFLSCSLLRMSRADTALTRPRDRRLSPARPLPTPSSPLSTSRPSPLPQLASSSPTPTPPSPPPIKPQRSSPSNPGASTLLPSWASPSSSAREEVFSCMDRCIRIGKGMMPRLESFWISFRVDMRRA